MSAAKYLSADQAAEELNLHRATIYRLIKDGQIQVLKVGRRKLIPRWALDNFEAKNTEAAPWANVSTKSAAIGTAGTTTPATNDDPSHSAPRTSGPHSSASGEKSAKPMVKITQPRTRPRTS